MQLAFGPRQKRGMIYLSTSIGMIHDAGTRASRWKPARSKMCCDFVMCEFGADHGVHEICGRILSKNLHVTHSFDTYDRDEMKMNLSGWLTAYPSLGRTRQFGVS
jgi:hypothetical protein